MPSFSTEILNSRRWWGQVNKAVREKWPKQFVPSQAVISIKITTMWEPRKHDTVENPLNKNHSKWKPKFLQWLPRSHPCFLRPSSLHSLQLVSCPMYSSLTHLSDPTHINHAAGCEPCPLPGRFFTTFLNVLLTY